MHSSWQKLLGTALDRRPSVGRLVTLCEENYALMLRLLPDLREMDGEYLAFSEGHAELHLKVLEHSRYTSLLHLTYYFHHAGERHPEPDAILRVYHDSKQLEVVELRQADTVLSAAPLYEVPGLSNKWQLNWFISKWLGHCVGIGYHFRGRGAVSDGELVVDLHD